ncbi:sterile alpha motif domain-containing protein 3-like isoform X2 [Sinocyclocheilus grahami]|uniref:sterile alpha motif domain-containing protein 3-like isoform X2 n=1 Tax=Sinocyclocheilus grahami TaxID=75366 RepID=UPI0007AC6A68|nr:PREDICTED: sterile alpha motif domain-containing protein 3-like isoform X2 [Sinocyclocheilus grahami]
MLFHVILADDDIRRVQIESLPETVDELMTILQNRLDLEGDIVVQFKDPEFNELCNLTEMSDLPTERPRLKVIVKEPPNMPTSAALLDGSCSETAAGTSASSACPPSTSRYRHWPDPFIIPTFSYYVELKLKKGNETYKRNGSLLTVNSAMKRDILDKVASAMYEYNAYPTTKQIEDVAQVLIEKHPCLREPGSTHGWYCWKFSLAFKMGNLRQKYRIAGCPELTINHKRSTGTSLGKKMKKAKRSELNFLPDFPDGKSSDCLEGERLTLMEEIKKKKRDRKIIDSLMESTFALRRKEIVHGEPLVSEIKDRWPALFLKKTDWC